LFREELRADKRAFFHPILASGVVFEVFFYVPLGVYLYYFYPAWSWMYFFDLDSIAQLQLAILGVIMPISYLVSLVIGFEIVQFLLRRQMQKVAFLVLILAIIFLSAFCLLTLNRLLWVGDYQAWKNANAILLLRHRLSCINAVMAVAGFGSLTVMLRKLKS